MKPDRTVEAALARLADVSERRIKNPLLPGGDVSVFRALRELHRSLSVSPSADMYDPRRLIRTVLFEGIAGCEGL